jgi:hypothetical protein
MGNNGSSFLPYYEEHNRPEGDFIFSPKFLYEGDSYTVYKPVWEPKK